jgi:hydroxymethylbilane synthase
VQVELVKIKTTGDKILDSPLSRIGGKGLFVKEIEDALLEERVDLAVHSMKDVPAELPGGLTFASFPRREDPRDAFVSLHWSRLGDLPADSRVGTSSLRRAAQLLRARPDLEIVPLRGNVDTRLRKVREGTVDAVILATAGLRRLGFADRITEIIPENVILPAIGQGALGLEVREADKKTIDILQGLNHEPTEWTVRAERALLKELGGGCQVPMAAYCRVEENQIHLLGMVADLDGSRMIQDEMTGDRSQAMEMGAALGRRLLEAGAGEILEAIYGGS